LMLSSRKFLFEANPFSPFVLQQRTYFMDEMKNKNRKNIIVLFFTL